MTRRGSADPQGLSARTFLAFGLAATCLCSTAGPARSLTLVDSEDTSLNFALRLQPRIELERLHTAAGAEWRRDFVVRRTRMSAYGKMQKVYYKLEWKIDGVDRLGQNPGATAENAYVQYPLGGTVELRAGLYDLPYSRDRLTSDSQQLAVDRGNVSNVPDALGLVDNAVGFHVLGKAAGGHAEYALGLFDNRTVATRLQDMPMVTGRVDLNFGSTKDVFMDAHFGQESWYSLGLNGSYQSLDSTGAADGSNGAAGIDGMLDVPWAGQRLFVRAEVNHLGIKPPGGGRLIHTTTWMAGLGVLLLEQKLQPMVRFDQVLLDDALGGGSTHVTYAGGSYFLRRHNLKMQADARFEAGTGEALDGARLQAQLYY